MGIFDSKSSSAQADGSNNANSQTGNGVTLLPTITAGKSIKNMSLTNNVSVSYLDGGVIENAFNFASDAIGEVGSIIDGANGLSELAVIEMSETTNTLNSIVGDIAENQANLVNNFGERIESITNTAIDGNQYLTDRSFALADSFVSQNMEISSQFGVDLKDAYQGYQSGMQDAFAQNSMLAETYGSNVLDLASQTQDALVDMAILQEQGLDNALQIAGSIGTDDNSEASTKMVQYVMLGVGALAVALVFKR